MNNLRYLEHRIAFSGFLTCVKENSYFYKRTKIQKGLLLNKMKQELYI